MLLFLLGGVVYWNSFQTPFLWDEDFLIVSEPRIHHWSRLPDIFQKPFLSGSHGFSRYWRPLVTLSFRIDYFLWKTNPVGYHLTNFAFHGLNSFLVFLLYRALLGNLSLSFLGALVFLLHPAHVEAVTYIPGRVDLLPLFFILLSFYCTLLGRTSRKKVWLYLSAGFFYLLALLSKEMAAFFPFIFLAYLLWVDREKKKWLGAEGALFLGMVSLLLVWGLFRRYVSIQIPLLALLDIPRFLLRLFVLPEILASYAKIWFFPWPLHMERVVSIEVLSVKTLILEWSALAAVTIGSFAFFRKGLERFWLVWIAMTLAPVLQIVPVYMSWRHLFIAEHFLYFSSVGIIGLLASHFGPKLFPTEGARLPLKGSLLIGAVLASFCFIVIWRNGEYQDRILFFEQTVRHAPWSSRAYNQLGLAYRAVGKIQEAERAFWKAIQLEPNEGIPYMNLGDLALRKKDFEKTAAYYQKGLQLMPKDSAALYGFGVLHGMKGEWKEALSFYEKAIQNDPENICAYSEKSHAYWELGEKNKALVAINEGLKVDPTSPFLLDIKRWIEAKIGKGEKL